MSAARSGQVEEVEQTLPGGHVGEHASCSGPTAVNRQDAFAEDFVGQLVAGGLIDLPLGVVMAGVRSGRWGWSGSSGWSRRMWCAGWSAAVTPGGACSGSY
jgi:hypothetical protein